MTREFPELDELLLVTVDRILGTSVFVKLEEYNKEGVVNFSEVAPGRIRNIRDYVKPGQKIVCKVLRVDPSKGHIDLSLRRVSLKDKKEVAEKYRKKNDFFVMLNVIINDKNKIQEIKNKSRDFHLDELLNAIESKNIGFLAKLGISNEALKKVFELIEEKIRSKKVFVKSDFSLKCELPDGIERIKKILKDCNKDNTKIIYLGAPNYLISIEGADYKDINKKMKELLEILEKRAKENLCVLELNEK